MLFPGNYSTLIDTPASPTRRPQPSSAASSSSCCPPTHQAGFMWPRWSYWRFCPLAGTAGWPSCSRSPPSRPAIEGPRRGSTPPSAQSWLCSGSGWRSVVSKPPTQRRIPPKAIQQDAWSRTAYLSGKPSLVVQRRSVRQPWMADGKADTLINGRESGHRKGPAPPCGDAA